MKIAQELSDILLHYGVDSMGMKQLEIYAALFCLEYKIKPTVKDIAPVMDKIIIFDEIVSRIKEQEEV